MVYGEPLRGRPRKPCERNQLVEGAQQCRNLSSVICLICVSATICHYSSAIHHYLSFGFFVEFFNRHNGFNFWNLSFFIMRSSSGMANEMASVFASTWGWKGSVCVNGWYCGNFSLIPFSFYSLFTFFFVTFAAKLMKPLFYINAWQM